MALTDNLVAYYKLDESSGNAADASGAGLTLTNTNTVAFAAGKINNGASFTDTSSQYFTSSNAAFSLTGSFSIGIWLNASAAQVNAKNPTILGNPSDASGTNGYLVRIENNGYIFFRLGSGSTKQTSSQGGGTGNIVDFNACDSTFHYIVCTYNGTNADIYIDTTHVASRVIAASLASPGNFNLGKDFGTNYMNGKLDEFGLWSRVLSGTEISQLYNGGAGIQFPFGVSGNVSTLAFLGAG